MSEAYIIDYCRTPFGRYGGALSAVRPDDLAAIVLKALRERNPFDPARIDDCLFGCANQAGEDNRNVARMALLLAGYPVDVPGTTLNRLCGSGLDAISVDGRGEWYQGDRVAAPVRGSNNKLRVQLSADGVLTAHNNGQALFADYTIPEATRQAGKVALKLGSFNQTERTLIAFGQTEQETDTETTPPTEHVSDWRATSPVAGTATVQELNGVRYNVLASTIDNDNGQNIAVFEKEGLVVDEQDNATVSIEFKNLSTVTDGRFGVLLHYKDPSNFVFVGYDAGGWF